MTDLMQLEQEFEDNAYSLGAKRFAEKLKSAREKKSESMVGAGRTLMRHYLDAMTDGIRYMCEKPGRGRRHVAVTVCKEVGYETAAYMTLKAVIDGISGKNKARVLAANIAGLILDELRYRRFRAETPKLFAWRMREFNTSNYHHMKRSMDATMHYAEIDTSDINAMLTTRERMLVGFKLLDFVTTLTELVRVQRVTRRNHTTVTIEATDTTLVWLKEKNNVLQNMLPLKMPMVVPPKDWAPGVCGGYRFALHGKDTLVRAPRSCQEEIEEWDMPVVYESVNKIQSTPYKINEPVRAMIEQAWEKNISLTNAKGKPILPSLYEDKLPTKPKDIATNEDARREWKFAAHQVHEANHDRRIAALSFDKLWGVVRRVKDLEAIWFPMNLDFRGRAYPLGDFLQPQGDDICRSLLTYADERAKEVGEEGAYVLAEYGAVLMDEDPRVGTKLAKANKKERRQWTVDNTKRIVQTANNPFGRYKDWWTKADKPLQFYAWCVEWARFQDEGIALRSSFPIHMDGSCNGVQHFSAMLRDSAGAASVNLKPSDRPSDLYGDIAEQVRKQLESELSSEPMAAQWLSSGLLNRTLCKRPTMTFGYGSKQYGFRQQLMSDFPLTKVFGKDAYKLAGYMAKQIWMALQSNVNGAFTAMQWLQNCTRVAVNETSQPITWTVPSGFKVTQRYYVRRQDARLETVLAGKIMRPGLWSEDKSQANVLDQVDGVAPNFVHSLDAAALMFTVVTAAKAGVDTFSTVHDSYATVAADYNTLNLCTRETMVWLYEQHDVLREWLDEQQFFLGCFGSEEELDDPPPQGTFDLSEIRNSEYFFS